MPMQIAVTWRDLRPFLTTGLGSPRGHMSRALYSTCIAALAPICLCCVPATSHAQAPQSAVRERFLKEAPAQWEEYARRASRLQGSFSNTLVGTNFKLASSWEFKINDQCRLIQTSWERSSSGKTD